MLSITLKTVLGHRNKMRGKLDLHNRTDLIKFAARKGLSNIEYGYIICVHRQVLDM